MDFAPTERSDVGLDFGEPSRAPQRIQSTVYCDTVRPRPKLRLPAVRRQRAEDLDPHFLRDVRRHFRIPNQPSHHGVNVRSVERPERSHRPFIAVDGALNGLLISSHHAAH